MIGPFVDAQASRAKESFPPPVRPERERSGVEG